MQPYTDTMFKLLMTKIQNIQFAVYISDTPVTLTHGQGHKIYNDNVDPKQGYNHAKFEQSCLMVSQKKRMLKIFFKGGHVNNVP